MRLFNAIYKVIYFYVVLEVQNNSIRMTVIRGIFIVNTFHILYSENLKKNILNFFIKIINYYYYYVLHLN